MLLLGSENERSIEVACVGNGAFCFQIGACATAEGHITIGITHKNTNPHLNNKCTNFTCVVVPLWELKSVKWAEKTTVVKGIEMDAGVRCIRHC